MSKHSTQIAIIGGGICGLWLLNILRQRGYDVWLFEKDSLGGKQTMAAQGMIHGGLKYALGGFATPSSESIATMPDTWRLCLSGKGQIDLSGLSVLSDDYYLFSDGSLSSKVTAFFASKTLQGRISEVDKVDYPEVFSSNEFNGKLYRLQDLVIDTLQLVDKLSRKYRKFIFKGAPDVLNDNGKVLGLAFDSDLRIVADQYIFAAGEGNQGLVSDLQTSSFQMQQRPLQQVMLKGELPRIYAHAVSLKSVNKPSVTITSHPTSDNRTVWYLGGDLAESGVDMPGDQLIETARRKLQHFLPWVNLKHTEWATLNINRAEPSQALHHRPDSPFVRSKENATVCWPTKLTLTPMLGDEVLKQIMVEPSHIENPTPPLPEADLARMPWEIAFD